MCLSEGIEGEESSSEQSITLFDQLQHSQTASSALLGGIQGATTKKAETKVKNTATGIVALKGEVQSLR